MAYARMQDFVPDFHAAETLAAGTYGAFYKRVQPELAWKAYANAKEKTDPNRSVLGLMLFGRHAASMKKEVATQAESDGRELFGLALFGYRQVVSDHSDTLGSAFEVQDPRKATSATLVAYQQAMNALTKTAAEKAFKDAGFQIAHVGF